jgi:peptide/nickel transport system permease protein
MDRGRFIFRRLLQTIPLLAGIMLLVLLLLHVVPGDPARAIGGISASEEQVDQLVAALDSLNLRAAI